MNASTVYHLIAAKQASSPNRLWKDVGLVLAILTVLMIIGQFSEPMQSHRDFTVFAFAMFIIAAREMGGHTFTEFKNEKIAYQWLTLPATTGEKWLSNFITSLVLVPVAFLCVLTLATLTTNLFLLLFGWGQAMPIFNPLSHEGVFLMKAYIGFHPLLFFGAIYFKKRPILKVTGALSLLLLALALYIGFVADFLFSGIEDQFSHMEADWTENSVLTIGNSFKISENGVEFDHMGALKMVAYVLHIGYFAFFWGLSYLRLKELEL